MMIKSKAGEETEQLRALYGCMERQTACFAQYEIWLGKTMRKAQKQQAEELVKQMEEAHDQFKKFIEQGSIPPAMELLEEWDRKSVV